MSVNVSMGKIYITLLKIVKGKKYRHLIQNLIVWLAVSHKNLETSLHLDDNMPCYSCSFESLPEFV